jgi:hypothetical protein
MSTESSKPFDIKNVLSTLIKAVGGKPIVDSPQMSDPNADIKNVLSTLIQIIERKSTDSPQVNDSNLETLESGKQSVCPFEENKAEQSSCSAQPQLQLCQVCLPMI